MIDGILECIHTESESERLKRIAAEWEHEELFGNMDGYRSPDTF